MEWNGPKVIATLRSELVEGLDGAGHFVLDRWKEAVGELYQGVHSEPGHPPLRRTGELQESGYCQTDSANLTEEVGATAPFFPFLELGTRTMLPRPSLAPTVAENASRIHRILTGQEKYRGGG